MTLKGSLSDTELFFLIIILRLNGDMMEGNPTSLVEEQEGMVRVKRAVGGKQGYRDKYIAYNKKPRRGRPLRAARGRGRPLRAARDARKRKRRN